MIKKTIQTLSGMTDLEKELVTEKLKEGIWTFIEATDNDMKGSGLGEGMPGSVVKGIVQTFWGALYTIDFVTEEEGLKFFKETMDSIINSDNVEVVENPFMTKEEKGRGLENKFV